MSVVKPFEHHGHYTGIHNALLDSIMPVISSSAWTLLCLMIRQTKGWQREEQGMSYRQLLEGTGFGSRTTLAKALGELHKRDLIVIEQTDNRFDPFVYAINHSVEIEWTPRDFGAKTSPESVPVHKSAGTESGLDTGTENGLDKADSSGTENGLINRKEESNYNKEKKEKAALALLAFDEVYPMKRTIPITEAIENASISDEQVWRESVSKWKTNGYSMRNIAGLIDFYKQNMERSNGKSRWQEERDEQARKTLHLIQNDPLIEIERRARGEMGARYADERNAVYIKPLTLADKLAQEKRRRDGVADSSVV